MLFIFGTGIGTEIAMVGNVKVTMAWIQIADGARVWDPQWHC